MFNKNFYPTPTHLIQKMIDYHKYYKKVLEPSAGKGDIIDYIATNNHFRHSTIHAIELNQELQMILHGKPCVVVGTNFLEYETNDEYDLIIMNPPFDEGARHLLKAIELAERQSIISCDVRCILNAETIKNPYSNERKALMTKLVQFGATFEYELDAFLSSERKTAVESVIIKFNVPCRALETKYIYQDILDSMKSDRTTSNVESAIALMGNQEIKERASDIATLCMMYQEHVKLLKDLFTAHVRLKAFNSCIKDKTYLNIDSNFESKWDDNLSILRIQYWRKILNVESFRKVLTNESQQDLQNMISETGGLEINEENVLNLLKGLESNKGNILKETLIKMFEKLTAPHMASFSNNIHYYNGWKSNDAFKINKKIIYKSCTYSGHTQYSYDSWNQSFRCHVVEDLQKCLALFEPSVGGEELTYQGDGVFESETFKAKCHIKGTTHLTIKNIKLLESFNMFVGQQKNWLPTYDEINKDPKAKTFIQSIFEDVKVEQLIIPTRGANVVD